MLLRLGAKVQFVHVVDDVAQTVTTLNLVFDLSRKFRRSCTQWCSAQSLLFETVQVREELLVYEVTQVITYHCRVVVELPILALGRSPDFPAVWLSRMWVYVLPSNSCFQSFFLFKGVEVLEE